MVRAPAQVVSAVKDKTKSVDIFYSVVGMSEMKSVKGMMVVFSLLGVCILYILFLGSVRILSILGP